MRILVVGAGAIGGYFGGRLLQAGRDVTFLVRPRRALELSRDGLVIQSPRGDLKLHAPPTVLAQRIAGSYDLILLSCKAYDLAAAVDSMAAAVGPATLILPVLNGMQHLESLNRRFGAARILGGLCIIAATLDSQRRIVHLNDHDTLVFGERTDAPSAAGLAAEAALCGAGFNARRSGRILQEMWEKWVLLATLAGSTCLLRASIGDIMASPGGAELIRALLEECRAIAAAAGYAPQAAFLEMARAALTAKDSPLTASMLRDVENHAPVEADHVLGDLLRRRDELHLGRAEPSPLAIAYTHLKAYEARRARTAGAAHDAG
jgi:2-dehydropantoate 2-reductase